MKPCIFIIFSLSFGIKSFAQQAYIDRAPSERENYLPVEGGSIHMDIDSTTSLQNLIERLSGNWQFIETGKAYWIGYTNDMFSIAARGDSAIGPLVTLVETSTNEHARIGAIYTIHLIGIQRRIVGRLEEKFIDTSARKALLYLLKYQHWQSTIMVLLIRDPWKSDVPDLIECLKKSDAEDWAVVDGLCQYDLKNIPICQNIPDKFRNIVLRLRYTDPNVLERDFGTNGQIEEILDSLIALKNDSIMVEGGLPDRPLGGNISVKFGHATRGDRYLQLSVGEFLAAWEFKIFKKLGYQFQYYVDNGKLYICSANTSKRRWIDWWTNLTAAQLR